MMDTTGFRQFAILMYKGLLLRKRHYIVTFFEIVIPVMVAAIPAIIMSEVVGPYYASYKDIDNGFRKSNIWKNYSTYLPFDPYQPDDVYYENKFFVYTPTNPFTDQFMNDTVARFQEKSGFKTITLVPVKTEGELEAYSSNKQRAQYSVTIFGTVLNNFESGVLPESLDYKIRRSDGYYNTKLKYRVNGPQRYYSNRYQSTNFLAWQAAVEETFIQRKMEENNVNIDYKVWMQRFPYPEHIDTTASLSAITFVPWCFCVGFLIFIINIVRRVIEEKSNGSKELLKMMGMSDFVYWTSTFINYFIVAVFTMVVTTIVYKAPLRYYYVFIKEMDPLLLFILLLIYMASLILFCMAFSIFFTKPIFAVIALIIVYFFSFSMFFTTYFVMNTELNYMPLSVAQKLGICLLPTGSLLTMFTLISFYENTGEGAHWNNLTEFSIIPDLNMLMVLLAILASCVFYIIIIWYFDKVWPWQPGVPQPFYFPFTKSYWCSAKNNVQVDELQLVGKGEINADFFEVEPSSSPGVVIKNLSKEFRSGLQTKLAVNDLSLNIYQGQITALLGHNGAGKTTTINILTGLYSPSKGTASINGLDILTETTKARRGLGVCPQHNVLYDTLTVDEHLRIYAAMKGVPWGKLGIEAADVLEILKLTPKRYELVKNLSGGMKRKLSLAIAIVGGSKVLFLDEPTSGLDVEARRSVWDALLNIRHDRTIVLTTHYMEEADILGDRIAIMAEGEVQCCGSPMFLKQKFGTGYHLHIVKGTNFELNNLTTLLQKYIPGLTVGKELDKEVTFSLADSVEGFGDMFEALENSKQKLGIVSFGITITTMEDVFLNVADISDMKYKMESGGKVTSGGAHTQFEDVYGGSSYLTLKRTVGNQLFGLLLKRFHYSKRHWGVLIMQLAIPFILLCVLLSVIKNLRNMNIDSSDPLKLDISQVYGSTDGFYFMRDEQTRQISDAFADVLKTDSVAVKKVDEPTHYVLQYGKSSISNFLKTLMVGGAFDTSNGTWNLTAWYNGEPYHACPMSLLMMHSAVLKKVAKVGTITLTNAPLPNPRDSVMFNNDGMVERLMAGTIAPLIFGFIVASFTLVPTHENTTKAKLLQIMSGVHPVLYWASMFIWDFIVYIAICILMIIPFAMFSHYAFFAPHSDAIGTALLIMLFYGWSSIPFSYLLSFIFKKGNAGFSLIVGYCCIFGTGIGTTLRIFQFQFNLRNNPVKGINDAIWFFRLFPPFSLSVALQNLFGIAYHNSICESVSPDVLKVNCESSFIDEHSALFQCCKELCGNSCLTQINPLAWNQDSSGPDIFFMFLDGAIQFAILVFLETTIMANLVRHLKHVLARLKKSVLPPPIPSTTTEDSEVLAEDARIRNALMTRHHAGDEALVVLDLTKIYRNFFAVDHLTLGIHKEECFGLLGVNGAGKTTTFRMLTGDCFPTEGNAMIQSFSVTTHLEKFQSFLGYCPQFDALIDRLTGREMLQLFARLRGLSGSELVERVDKMIKMTDLSAHADKQTQFYSGGNKRKLSVGIALIGSPPLLLLDEPTAGVDPVSRRKIWNILSQARNNTGASVILTTHRKFFRQPYNVSIRSFVVLGPRWPDLLSDHANDSKVRGFSLMLRTEIYSMEESEALCSRLAIMVNGRFRCLGSIQQLKSKYGQGYTLVIKMKREQQGDPQAMINIKAHVEGNMRGVQLKDDHQGMVQYHIIDPSVTLSRLFKFMSQMKSQFDLEDYLISDTSLEQIFLTFARSQRIQA